MAALVKEVRLIFAENGKDPKTGKLLNSYKYWEAKLYDDGNWTAEWGRVGCENPDSGTWNESKKTMNSVVRSKLKKGYTEQKTIGETVASYGDGNVVKNIDLHAIAISQLLKTSTPVLDRLIKRFVDANIHKITSSTQITYNSTTGLFTTPLGIVEKSGLTEARDLLAKLAPKVRSRKFGADADTILCQYLRIIPQSLGMKRFSTETVIPDDNALQKQLDLIDSLESSYQALQNVPAPSATQSNKNQEQIFKVDLDVLTDKAEINRLTTWFNRSNHSTHGYSNIRIVNYLKLKIHDNWNNFNEKLGNLTEVWHGTGEPNLLSILKIGLKASPPATTKITGKMFGEGHYGAVDSSKSMQYTFGRFGGSSGTSGWLIVADFALGNTYYIKSYGGNKPHGYDSIWAKKENTGLRFDELIVPRDNQLRIKYLLELK